MPSFLKYHAKEVALSEPAMVIASPTLHSRVFYLTLESRLWSIRSPPVENVVTLILVNY